MSNAKKKTYICFSFDPPKVKWILKLQLNLKLDFNSIVILKIIQPLEQDPKQNSSFYNYSL